jgi:hypothetical protein
MAVLGSLRDQSDIAVRLRQSIDQAIDAQSDKATQRARAWQQFKNLPTGTEIEGRSQLQSSDVNSMITAVCAQMVISFAQDQVATFPADNQDDEDQAAAESRAVNKVLIADNGGFGNILAGVQNALMYRNGYVKCWWKDDIVKTRVSFEGVEANDLPVLTESEQGTDRRLLSYDPDKRTARVEVTNTRTYLCVEACANDRFFADPDYERGDLDDCSLCGEVHYKTRDELVRMGWDGDLVDSLPAVQKYTGIESSNAPNRRMPSGQVQPVVHQMDMVRVYEAYARLAFNEDDDRAYLYKCWLCDRTEETAGWGVDPEPVQRVPYAAGTAFPIANQHEGEALSEKLYQVQAGKTEFLRQWNDNVQNCSFGRYGVVIGQAETADVMTPKAGGPVRIKSPGSLVPIPVIDVGPSIKLAIDQLDAMRSERGGASLDMVGAEMQLAGDTAHGTERVYAAKELLVSYMARNLAESMIRRLFLLGHAELRDGDGGPISLKVGEQWQTVDPRQWKPRTNVNVTVAPSFGERMLQANTLFAGIQLYMQGLTQGLDGVMLTLPGLYKMVVDWLTLNLVDNAEAYLLDPASPQSQQAAQQKAQQQQQAAQQQTDQQTQILAVPEKIKADTDKYKTDQKTMFDYFKATLDAMVQANQTETEGAVNVATAGAQAKAVTNANAGGAGSAGKGANGNGAARGNGKRSTGSAGKSAPGRSAAGRG